MYVRKNKKIIFVNPPLGIDERYGQLGQTGGSEPPLGLCYLASTLRKEGFTVGIIDAQAMGISLRQTQQLIWCFRPHYVGISACTMAIGSASQLASLVKATNPGIKVILGGCHVSALPEQTLKEHTSFDAAVIGEGEETFRDLIVAYENDAEPKSIKGTAVRVNGGVSVLEMRPRIKDLDSLPLPAFDLLPDIRKFYRLPLQSLAGRHSFSLVTSRGCPAKCSFCDKQIFGNYISLHSAGYIIEMMEVLQKNYGIDNILFEDDNFMVSKERLLALIALMHKKKLRVRWSALARIDSVDEKLLKIAKEGGCWQISYGIESGSQRILDFYRKGITLTQIKDAVKLANKAGLSIKGFFMWGNPTEDRDSIRETTEFINNLAIDDVSITFFTPYPGSEVWPHIESYGKLDKSYQRMSCFSLVFKPHGLEEEYLIKTRKQVLKDFYFKPKVLLSYLLRLRSITQLKGILLSAYYLFRYVVTPERDKSVKYIIVNADDFGLSEGINKGIIKAHQEGIVRSASLVACGKHFKEAVELAKENKELDVGVHLCLTEEVPLSPHQEIPSIVGRSGRFSNTIRRFMLKYILGKVKMGEIEKEFSAQIARLFEFGIEPSHIDSHCHLHMFFGIADVVIKLAKVYNIRIIRLPFVPVKFMLRDILKVTPVRIFYQVVLNLLCLSQRNKFINEGIRVVDSCFGLLDTGHMHKDKLLYIIKNIHPGISEILCHPGIQDAETLTKYGHWGYEWEKELESLIFSDTAALSRGYGIGLASFREIG